MAVVYNAFAPGVLPGTAPPPHEHAHITAPAPPHTAAAAHAHKAPATSIQDVKKNLEKVTGFADTYAKGTSAEAQLRQKVEELTKINEAAHAALLKTQHLDEAKRLKLLTKIQQAKAAKAAVPEAATKKPAPRFDGKFEDFVGGKEEAERAGATDKRVFNLLKSVQKAAGHVPTSHEAKDKAHEDKVPFSAASLFVRICVAVSRALWLVLSPSPGV